MNYLYAYLYVAGIAFVGMLAWSTCDIWRDHKHPPHEGWSNQGAITHALACAFAAAVGWFFVLGVVICAGVEYILPQNVRDRRREKKFGRQGSLY